MRSHNRTPNDAEAVRLVLAGRKEAFLTLLHPRQASVLGLCRRILGSESEAQDVAQEAALQAFLGLETLREPERFGSWLHSIAANLAHYRLRQKRRRPQLTLESLRKSSSIDTAVGSSERGMDRLVDSAPGPEEVRLARELHDEILKAIRGLSVANREAVVGYYLQGYSHAELAELLGVPVSTIKGRLHKGRKQLEPYLAPVARQALGIARKEQGRVEDERMIEVVVEDALKMPFDDERGLRALTAGGSLRELSDLVEAGADLHLPSIAVVLKEEGGERVLPVWMGLSEGLSIWSSIAGREMPRPMTHDLMRELLAAVDLVIESVAVVKLLERTFYGEISVKHRNGEETFDRRVDSRPSDAIALAVRLGVPIYVTKDVLDEAAFESKQALLEAQREGLGPFKK
jgi:RNA polymerase sigma factor (sigma-70 family)